MRERGLEERTGSHEAKDERDTERQGQVMRWRSKEKESGTEEKRERVRNKLIISEN